MKTYKITVLGILFMTMTAATLHKFYVSTTKIEYNEVAGSIEIVSKIFIDDIEKVLNERHNIITQLASKKETENDRLLLKEYILKKLKVKINDEIQSLDYLGVEYDIDVVNVFIEIKGVTILNSIEIENKILMDNNEDQQNIIHLKAKGKRRNLMLDGDNPKGV